ncbi:hypothetical protein AUJ65_06645 [Candidatus Micrarchaeota archaeon CG1_02_51_15]|nr:MAG: hypothetical protein AUJ65_06645 [Candidatus Micrarchaeota archaeon CG1_02_51_15]
MRFKWPDYIYSPREDSFLLAQAARKHAFGTVLDMGCGTGIIGLNAALNPKVKEIVFADRNPLALETAGQNAVANKLGKPTRFVRTNLFATLKNVKFDCICFNPPYLPAEADDHSPLSLRMAWEGGKTGRKVLDAFLRDFKKHLKQNGILLLLNSSLSCSRGEGNGNEETLTKLKKLGLTAKTIAKQDFFFEHVVVIRAKKK